MRPGSRSSLRRVASVEPPNGIAPMASVTVAGPASCLAVPGRPIPPIPKRVRSARARTGGRKPIGRPGRPPTSLKPGSVVGSACRSQRRTGSCPWADHPDVAVGGFRRPVGNGDASGVWPGAQSMERLARKRKRTGRPAASFGVDGLPGPSRAAYVVDVAHRPPPEDLVRPGRVREVGRHVCAAALEHPSAAARGGECRANLHTWRNTTGPIVFYFR